MSRKHKSDNIIVLYKDVLETDLTVFQKYVLSLICQLLTDKDIACIPNEKLSNRLNVEIPNISRAITYLHNKSYITAHNNLDKDDSVFMLSSSEWGTKSSGYYTWGTKSRRLIELDFAVNREKKGIIITHSSIINKNCSWSEKLILSCAIRHLQYHDNYPTAKQIAKATNIPIRTVQSKMKIIYSAKPKNKKKGKRGYEV